MAVEHNDKVNADLKWHDMCAATGVVLYESEYAQGWPQTFRLAPLATIQRPWKSGDRSGKAYCWALYRSLCNKESAPSSFVEPRQASHFDVDSGPENLYETRGETPPSRPRTEQAVVVTAGCFASWLAARGEAPSIHVQAWFDALAVVPDATLTGPGQTAILWTPERKKEAQDMVNELRGQGLKDFFRRAADHFKISTSRLRKVLRKERPVKAVAKAKAKMNGGWP